MLDPFSEGFLLGILVGEGHFGGDGKQPQITLRMDVRHEDLFMWLQKAVPCGKLYGPYHHAGRHYYQWMARGVCLRKLLVPMIKRRYDFLDSHIQMRFTKMCERYDI